METEVEKKFKRPLAVKLDEDEKVKKGHKAGLLKKAIQKVRIEMKAATSVHREELKEKQANLDSILDDLETGTEIRSVECAERKNYDTKKANVIRLDTEEIVESRSLMFDELQTKLGNVITEPEDDDEDGPSLAPKPKRGRPRKEARA